MAKSAKGKKERKQIVKRLKHKIIQKLQKSKNETKTQFMARKVVLRNQLVERECTNLVTRKRLEVKDLLNRLEHPSPRFRRDGLIGLKEILVTNDAILVVPLLSSIINCLGPMFLDLDGNLRGYTVRVLELLFQKMGKYIDPYFHILMDYMSCAMVSLDPEIQGDSLLFMDACICHKPYLLAQHSQILLKQLMFLISKKVTSHGEDMPVPLKSMREEEDAVITSKKSLKNPDQSIILAQNISYKLNNNKWRVKLVQMVEKFLKSIYTEREKIQTKLPISAWDLVQRGMSPGFLIDPQYGFSAVSNTSQPGLDILRNVDDLSSIISALRLTIMQIWYEVGPRLMGKGNLSGVLLTPLAANAAYSMLSTLLLLHKLVQECKEEHPDVMPWFLDQMKGLITRLIRGFPFDVKQQGPISGKEGMTGDKKEKNTNENVFDKSPDDLNLLTARVYLQFYPRSGKNRDKFLLLASDFYDTALQTSRCKISKLSTFTVLLMESFYLHTNQQGFREMLKKAFLLYQKLSSEFVCERFLLLPVLIRSLELDCIALRRTHVPDSWCQYLEKEILTSNSLTVEHLKSAIQIKMKFGVIGGMKSNSSKVSLAERFASQDKEEVRRLWDSWEQAMK